MVFGNKKKPFVLKTREERERDIMETELKRRRARPPKSPIRPIVKTSKRITSKGKAIAGKFKRKKDMDSIEDRTQEVSYKLKKERLDQRHKRQLEILDEKYRTKKLKKVKKGMSEKYQEERNALLRRQSLEREKLALENI